MGLSQERIDYCSCQQTPLPVNSVEGKQQLNDQTHFSSRQIKACKDSNVVFTLRVDVCKGRMHATPWVLYLCLCEFTFVYQCVWDLEMSLWVLSDSI